MTIYLGNGTKLALIARETAPAAADKDMFHGNANLTRYGQGAVQSVQIQIQIYSLLRGTSFIFY